MLRANNDLCLNCKKAECIGICDALRDDMGEAHGRRYARTITWHGVTRTINEWAEVLGISRQALYRKLGESDDIGLILSLVNGTRNKNKLPYGATEETIIRLSTMPLDYDIYWRHIKRTDSSIGMVTQYGKITSAPTNAVSKPTETRAIPEASLSDDELTRRGWIACVLYIIDSYRHGRKKNDRALLMGDILEWRALDGMTLKKICDRINETITLKRPMTISLAKRIMNTIIEDVAAEAVRRKLIVEPQK